MLNNLNSNLEMIVLGLVTLFFLVLGVLAWILMFKNIYLKITKRASKMKPCNVWPIASLPLQLFAHTAEKAIAHHLLMNQSQAVL
ncbi:hypothetical protein [Paenibacillus illinoisensis]|uniref:hypothetical protein n=1 Tax=Paenibacillus illinoisensis TaxID=59845 RepID=UPI003D95B5B2